MTAFALDLDHDGIRLLKRQGGNWAVLDTVQLDDSALAQTMKAMRDRAETLSNGPLETELVIPESQVLYTRIPLPPDGGSPDEAFIRASLDGLTPCPVDEMVFDWRVLADGVAVAALDINTLDEAESFAANYRFNPVRFSARPNADQFPDIPDFGPTQCAKKEEEAAPPAVFSSRRAVEEPLPDTGAPDLAEEALAQGADEAPADEPELENLDLGAAAAIADDAPALTAADASEIGVGPQDEPQETLVEAPDDAFADHATTIPSPSPEPPAKAPPLAAQIRPPVRTPEPTAAPRRQSDWRRTAMTVAVGAGVMTALVAFALYLVTPSEDLPTGAPGQTGRTLPEEVATVRIAPLPGLAIVRELGTPALDVADVTIPLDQMQRRSAALDTQSIDATVPVPSTAGGLRSADVWQTPPPTPPDPVGQTLDSLYLAAVDPAIPGGDALALPETARRDFVLAQPRIPPQAGQTFELGADGRVIATPDGVETPDGVLVVLGRPPIVPPSRPEAEVPQPEVSSAAIVTGAIPRPRPSGLVERTERALLGGRTRQELSQLAPRPRTASAQETAVANASLVPSRLAVTSSPLPPNRPADLAARAVASAVARTQPSSTTTQPDTRETARASFQPTIPTTASVARQATIPNAINLRRVNLIGVYGSARNRRALVRLPSGRYVKLEVGDRVDGGRVSSISDGELQYVKSGRRVKLTVPSG